MLLYFWYLKLRICVGRIDKFPVNLTMQQKSVGVKILFINHIFALIY